MEQHKPKKWGFDAYNSTSVCVKRCDSKQKTKEHNTTCQEREKAATQGTAVSSLLFCDAQSTARDLMQTIRIVFFFLKTRMRDNTTSQKGENETNPGETLAANLWQRTLVRTPGSPEFAAGVHHWSSPASVFARVRFIVPSSPGFGKWSSLLPFSGGGLFCPSLSLSLSLSLGRWSCSSVLIVLNPLFSHGQKSNHTSLACIVLSFLWVVVFHLLFGFFFFYCTKSDKSNTSACKERTKEVISYTVHTITRSKSGVSYRRPRTRSLVHCVFHDPGQRGVPCASTAFRRRTISRLN